MMYRYSEKLHFFNKSGNLVFEAFGTVFGI